MNDEPLFDRLGLVSQIGLIVLMCLLIPVWFPLWIINEIMSERKQMKETRLRKEQIIRQAEEIKANKEFLEQQFRKIRANVYNNHKED